jgi:hypothetical protein
LRSLTRFTWPLNVLKIQKERQEREKARLSSAWGDRDLVFAWDGWRLRSTDRAGGPQGPDNVSARWRTLRTRLGLPEKFRLHDSRASKINNDLDAGENPVEVAAKARHHNPGYTMGAYGRRRADSAKRLAGASADRVGCPRSMPDRARSLPLFTRLFIRGL